MDSAAGLVSDRPAPTSSHHASMAYASGSATHLQVPCRAIAKHTPSQPTAAAAKLPMRASSRRDNAGTLDPAALTGRVCSFSIRMPTCALERDSLQYICCMGPCCRCRARAGAAVWGGRRIGGLPQIQPEGEEEHHHLRGSERCRGKLDLRSPSPPRADARPTQGDRDMVQKV